MTSQNEFDRIPNPHLTEAEFGSVIAGVPCDARVQTHLLSCAQCSAEVADLRESLLLFREASDAFAARELRRIPPVALPNRRLHSPSLQPMYWLAAAAMLLAALLPLQVIRRHEARPTPTVAVAPVERSVQSDEALLEDINRETSEAVPSPMQALADPTSSLETYPQNSTQRKN